MGAPKDLLKASIPLLAKRIEAELEPREGSAGKGHSTNKYLRMVDPMVASMITCRTVFDSVSSQITLTACAAKIGARIEDELRFKAFKRQDPGLFKYAMERVKHSSDYRYQHRVLAHRSNRSEKVKAWKAWPTKDKLRLGARLIDLLADETGVVERTQLLKRGKVKETLVPSADVMAWITRRDTEYEALHPWFMPTTTPPVDWTDVKGGGYPEMEHPLVKHGTISERELREHDLSTVYACVNALQRTAWKVNEDVLETASELYFRGYEMPGLPSRERIPFPVRPFGVPEGVPISELPVEQQVEMKAWKRVKSEVYGQEARRCAKIMGVRQILEVAKLYRSEPAIYFPHQVDFRGRAYPQPLFLTPQGRDFARGMLTFAEGRALGPHGAKWLAIHGANLWGKDKLPFDERVAWVNEHDVQIMAVAGDPLSELWWTEAEEPWQFLAWCLEWSAYLASGQGPEFVSHLPVSQDGSCNGLQHFSAMLRDERGGQAVNLVPSEKPQDIYASVAAVVEAKLRASGDPLAREWLASGLLGRAVVKRQVMTLPYGATKQGMVWQLESHLRRVRDDAPQEFKLADLKESAKFLTPLVWDSIGEVVASAMQAMDYLKVVARSCNKRKVALRWVTPHGFPVRQAYPALRKSQVRTVLLGSAQLVIREPRGDGALDGNRQVNGVSPNFVHSLDAAHMMLTMAALGPESASWYMVHDSFGTHAGDAERLAVALREQFFLLYAAHDPLVEMAKSCGVDPLPARPADGTLKLAQVVNSPFFFA